jgi:hypothetical protein
MAIHFSIPFEPLNIYNSTRKVQDLNKSSVNSDELRVRGVKI